MRKVIVVLLVVGLMGLLASMAMAATTGDSTIGVEVPPIDVMTVSNGGTIVLGVPEAGDDDLTAGLAAGADSTGKLNFSYNGTAAHHITAQASAAVPGTAGNAQDITLKVAVTGGATQQTLVDGGAAVMNDDAVIEVIADPEHVPPIEGVTGVPATAAAPTVYNITTFAVLTDKDITYTASATTLGTRADTYVFTVTYTDLAD